MHLKVVIFGAGIAGLSAAHYLIQRGYDVLVIESLDVPGGLARSERVSVDNGMPSEYSWRGFGPWYHNSYSLMKEIPIYKNNKELTNIYDEELSNPINFIITPDSLHKFDYSTNNFDNKFRLTFFDKAKLAWWGLKTCMASDARSHNEYALTNANEKIKEYLSPEGAQTVSSLFGPWIGTDYTRASMHHVASFFRRNVSPGSPAPYSHPKSDPPFIQGGLSGWLVLRRPSNEAWFDPWVALLRNRGVKFMFGTKLEKLEWNESIKKISYAVINLANNNNQKISADYYVLAINPYITKKILDRAPSLVHNDSQLSLFTPLTTDSPHKQISFRISFLEKIHLPGKEVAVSLVDSEYGITFFSQDQLWHKDVFLGDNVKSLWSGTATVDSVPGKLYGLPMKYLTKSEFINEIINQIYRSKSLDTVVSIANKGRQMNSFPIERIEVWHSWIFPEEGTDRKNRHEIRDAYPKWVNNSNNFPYQPKARTSFSNLFLAGSHTQTFADLYSMEAAVESGRRVADLISGTDTVLPQHVPIMCKPFKMFDSIFYLIGLPNVLTVLLYAFIIFLFIRARSR